MQEQNKKIKNNGNKNIFGFTLIELLVVIAIIGLLSTLAVISLNNARSKARDAKRQHDLDAIRTALFLNYDKNNNWLSTGSGCGASGNGNGWFSYSGGSYPESMAQCLVDSGFLTSVIIDPSGDTTCTLANGKHAYMKYTCGTPAKTYVYARMENLPEDSTATDGTCCPSCDSSYGINYYVIIQ